jgi:hypothetical protein
MEGWRNREMRKAGMEGWREWIEEGMEGMDGGRDEGMEYRVSDFS